MPSEKAKGNKTLTSTCAACGKELSTELLSALVVGTARNRRLVPVCQACMEKGWKPPAEQPAAGPGEAASG
jgi:hypothetical protein